MAAPKALAPTLYHSGRSQDIAAVAQNLIEQDRISRFALAGYSMGGNLVLKLAGEWGSAGPAQFRAVAAVCPAVNLAASADALHLPGNRLYEQYFLWSLDRRLRTKARLFPGVFDTSRLRGIRSLREFDDRITAFYCGFTGADDYYDRSAAAHVVDRIAVPTFILNAANDPFIRILPETRQKILSNPHITFIETEDGGHCSYLAKANGSSDGRWAESQVVEFLRSQIRGASALARPVERSSTRFPIQSRRMKFLQSIRVAIILLALPICFQQSPSPNCAPPTTSTTSPTSSIRPPSRSSTTSASNSTRKRTRRLPWSP